MLIEVINDAAMSFSRELKRFTKDDLIIRAEESNADYQAGRVKTQEQLENESENW